MDTPAEEHVYHLSDSHPKAIVVYCSDNRFQNAFREFIANELHLAEGEYIPMVLSGGVASLSEPLRLPKEFKYVKERVEFFLERFTTVRRIVLINHEDCRHYEALKSSLGSVFLQHVSHMSERQTKDLAAAAKALLALGAPGLQIDLYYARIVKNGAATVQFEKITP
jgi:carbonic anhydrase